MLTRLGKSKGEAGAIGILPCDTIDEVRAALEAIDPAEARPSSEPIDERPMLVEKAAPNVPL